MATPEQITDLAAKLREERSALLATASTLSEEAAAHRPPDASDGEDGWSPKEQFAHLSEMDAQYRAWVVRALGEENPDVGVGTQPDPVAFRVERAHEASLAALIAEAERQRNATIAVMDGLPAEAYDRPAHNAAFGELTVLQWLRSLYRHDRMHAAQIAGREPDYRPRFLNGEPDQRRRG